MNATAERWTADAAKPLPDRSILTSTASADRPASPARSTNIPWSHDVDEVFGTHKLRHGSRWMI
jgi:hypothetical protein